MDRRGSFHKHISTCGYLATGGAWTDSSSPAVKTDIEPIDPDAILETLRDLPVSEWSYIADPPGVRHMGPMADDFYSLFGLGNNDTGIASLDTSGVALAAIQALDQKVQAQEAEIAALKAKLTYFFGL